MVERGWDPVANASSSTVHVSVVDERGMACAITASAGYGSGATIPGTGILLNNCLGEPELNRRGVHALTPGTRLGSNMAPAVGRRADGAVLAIGSPGADRITTALLQVLGGYALGGLDLQAAVDEPRLHVRHLDPPDADSDADSPDASTAGRHRADRLRSRPGRAGRSGCPPTSTPPTRCSSAGSPPPSSSPTAASPRPPTPGARRPPPSAPDRIDR